MWRVCGETSTTMSRLKFATSMWIYILSHGVKVDVGGPLQLQTESLTPLDNDC
jgi:hypothetical protein